ncbi:lipase family protein [Mycolicibacterium vinylchloridicum]|uniref:lipase family protein n=1 Tax=Mycolicibacterium vinylchloridicum TaxID=2736928 RepID=UPI0015CBE42A|nr:lipase family protein [Mycolicibacterium vinylchloridicum]
MIVALISVGCSGRPDRPPVKEDGPSENYGDVIASDAATDLDPSLQSAVGWAQRFTYASRSGINDSTTHVTGILLAPKGSPPQGGWRIVAFGHAATGTQPGCGPSTSPLLDSPAVLQQLLQAGYPVVMSDYQALGSLDKIQDRPGRDIYHPYLDSTTVGYNLIDSVRAARQLIERAVTPASTSFLALGIGQGGQAAWAANELMANQGQNLTLLGSVAISPAADITGLADLAEAGTLNPQQQLALQAFLAGVKNSYFDDFNLDDYRGGIVAQQWDALLACDAAGAAERATIAGQITPDDLRPHSPAAAATLRGFLKKSSLPQGPAQAPMLVIYGDNDPLVPAAWTDAALDRACKMGDVITIRRLPGDAPDQLDMPEALDWMNQRVNSVPAPNDCVGRPS